MPGVLAAALALHVADRAAAQDTQRLGIGLRLPSSSPEYRGLLVFKERVETTTNGAVTIDIRGSAEPRPLPEGGGPATAADPELRALLVDELVKHLPAIDIFIQPFMFSSPEVLKMAWTRGSAVRAPLDAEILRQLGYRVLWWQPNGPGVILSRGRAVTRPEDVAGRRVRVPGETLGRWIDACGGTPVQASVVALPELMTSGGIEIAMTHLRAVPSRRMWAWSDTLTLTRHYVGGIVFAIKETTFQSLSADHRALLETTATAIDREALADSDAIDQTTIEAVTANGLRVQPVTQDDIEAWKACSAIVLDRYVTESGALGAELLAGYRRVLVQYYRVR